LRLLILYIISMNKFTLFFFSCCIFLLTGTVMAGSLWQDGNSSPYVRRNLKLVGDILTVKIVESTTALQQAQTDLSKKTNTDLNALSSWDNVANLVSSSETKGGRDQIKGDITGGDDYKGKGQTTRKSVMKAMVTVMVTRELGNDLYEIEGHHEVRVNDEVEKITIKGIIRGQDIVNDNSIFSHQVANAQISVEGKGTVSAEQSPGILTRMFGWLF
jgi:flagellar L-ring protein FlgH